MRIKSISINNYRQYKSLDFTFNKISNLKNDLNIIIAQNGVGKSNFLNAITWCLYEKESHLQDSSKALPIVNLETISQAKDKEEIVVSVEMKIDIDGNDHTLKRTTTYIKSDTSNNKILRKKGELIFTKLSLDPAYGYRVPVTVRNDDASIFIDRIFPEGISEYFFFDNEQMNNYFTSNKGGNIQRAINLITKIDLLQKVSGRLRNLQKDYRTDFGSRDSLINDLQRKIDKQEDSNQQILADLDKIKQQIFDAEEMLTKISEEIKGAENLKELESKRDDLLNQKSNIKNDIKKIEDEIEGFIVRYTTLINMYPAFEKTIELINAKDKDRQLPPEINVEVLQRSIDDHKCQLCECELQLEQMKVIMDKLEFSNLTSPAFELLLTIRSKVSELMQETKLYNNKKDEILKQKNHKEEQLQEVENKLLENDNLMKAISDKDAILEKLNLRDQLNSSIKNLAIQQGSVLNEKERGEQNYNRLDSQINEAIRTKERDLKMVAKFEATGELLNYINDVEKEIIIEIRNEISEETFKNFSSLIWKENTYENIEIDEHYNIDLKHKRGYSAIGSTSAAERALLALSFTNAIHKVSGFESPLVIDSPVGRVSDDNRKRFAQILAEVSLNKQIIMLFTPDEYSKDVSDVFDNIAVKSYAHMTDSEEITTFKGA